jgi:hypothetical protein
MITPDDIEEGVIFRGSHGRYEIGEPCPNREGCFYSYGSGQGKVFHVWAIDNWGIRMFPDSEPGHIDTSGAGNYNEIILEEDSFTRWVKKVRNGKV